MHAGLVLSAHAHNIEYYVLVKVVNNASGTRLAGKLSTDWNAMPHRIRMYLVYIWCRERVSGVLADITKSPIAIKTKGSRGL